MSKEYSRYGCVYYNLQENEEFLQMRPQERDIVLQLYLYWQSITNYTDDVFDGSDGIVLYPGECCISDSKIWNKQGKWEYIFKGIKDRQIKNYIQRTRNFLFDVGLIDNLRVHRVKYKDYQIAHLLLPSVKEKMEMPVQKVLAINNARLVSYANRIVGMPTEDKEGKHIGIDYNGLIGRINDDYNTLRTVSESVGVPTKDDNGKFLPINGERVIGKITSKFS